MKKVTQATNGNQMMVNADECGSPSEQSNADTSKSLVKFLILGILFGIVFIKAEIISWYRIQEMFRMQSFHMYGVIGSAVLVGIISLQLIKRT